MSDFTIKGKLDEIKNLIDLIPTSDYTDTLDDIKDNTTMTTLEQKSYLFNPTYIATQGNQENRKVDFNTIYGTQQLSLPVETWGLLKDSQSTTVIKIPPGGPNADYVYIASTSANDTALGTGCTSVYLEGLNEEFEKVNEIIATNGLTPVKSTKKYSRINRQVAQSAGNNTSNIVSGMEDMNSPNLGIIYCGSGTFTNGIPENIYSTVQIGEGFSKQALASFPANYYPILKVVNTVSGGGKAVQFRLDYRFLNTTTGNPDSGWINAFSWESFASSITIPFHIGGLFYQAGDIRVVANAPIAGITGSTLLEMVLIRNDMLVDANG